MPNHRIPLWLKVGFSAWLIVWTILYARTEEPQHFLWLCHIGNAIIAYGLWTENGLLLSWQALSLLIPDLIWVADFTMGLTIGQTPLRAATYMFSDEKTSTQKGLAMFHLVLPMLLMWCLWRFGYDRRALRLQALMCCFIFPISYLLSEPKDNVNWVYGAFGKRQNVVPAPAYVPAAIVLYLLVLYVPSHLLLCALAPRKRADALENDLPTP